MERTVYISKRFQKRWQKHRLYRLFTNLYGSVFIVTFFCHKVTKKQKQIKTLSPYSIKLKIVETAKEKKRARVKMLHQISAKEMLLWFRHWAGLPQRRKPRIRFRLRFLYFFGSDRFSRNCHLWETSQTRRNKAKLILDDFRCGER